MANGQTFVDSNGEENDNGTFLQGAYFTEIVVVRFSDSDITLKIGNVTYEAVFSTQTNDYQLIVVE